MLLKLLRDTLDASMQSRRRARLTGVSPVAGTIPLRPADIAVVIPTICRQSLLKAVRSVFAQDYQGTIQVLVGVDADRTGKSRQMRATLVAECPSNMMLTWLDPGYSTSRRNGGIHACCFGGALRTILSFMANAPIVAYLDDDDWYLPNHLGCLARAIEGKPWAFSLCYYANGDSGKSLCVDEMESVGPKAGIFNESFGGFVRTSALALDKTKLAPLLHLWSEAIGPAGDGEDRLIFEQLKTKPYGETGEPTVCYALDPRDALHELRMRFVASKGVVNNDIPQIKNESIR